MNLVELFDSRDKKKRLSHVKNLVGLALADGNRDEDEMSLIFAISLKGGLTQSELKRIFDRPESIEFTPPDSFRERIEQLYDMVLLMMIDGEIHEKEMDLCKLTAIRLGFKSKIIDKIILELIDKIERGIVAEEALTRLMEFEAV